jgi:hypothetical protein
MDATLRTVVYIDGFNFYYGQLKGTPWRWINIETLFTRLLGPRHELIGIEYFTARVQPTAGNPDAHIRQFSWLEAQRVQSPIIKIHYGHFLRHKVRMENANPPPPTTQVWKTEEKGSDVNMALQILNDAWLDRYDCALVVSNDSDLAMALAMVKQQQSKMIGLVTPGAPRRKTSMQLRQHANFLRIIRESALRSSQLPQTIPGTGLHKPTSW